MNLIPIILAGGGGTRLWPLSRGHYPKQFLCVSGDKTLLQDTLLRLGDSIDKALEIRPPLVVCNEEHRFMVGEQARQIGHRLHGIGAGRTQHGAGADLRCLTQHRRRG